MKHTKFSKLVSVVLAACVLLLSAVSVTAASSVTAEQEDITSTKVKVNGVTEEVNMAGVTLMLLAPGVTEAQLEAMIESGVWDPEVVVGVGQTFADAGGSYSYEFNLPEDAEHGDYIVVATSNDVADSTTYFANPETRQEALASIINAAKDNNIALIIERLDAQGDNLGIDKELWAKLDTEAARKDAADAIIANQTITSLVPESLTAADVATGAKELNAEILTAALNANKIEDISAHKEKIKDEAAMAIYESLSAAAKTHAMSMILEKGYISANAMEKAFDVATKIAYMANDGLTDLTKFEGYAKDLGLTNANDFKNLTSAQKRGVVNAVAKAKPSTEAALNTAFKKAVESYKKDTSEGGFGGGGTPSYITSGGTEQIKYLDLGGYAWAEEAIYDLSNKGILAGYGNGVFSPANQIKREEFAKVIVTALYGENAAKAGKVPSFADAKNGWYSPFVGYAEETGLIKGISDEVFGIGSNIKRQDIMVILYRTMQAKGYVANTTPIAYGDAAEISDYAKDAVFALANAGIVGGYEDGTIRPLGEASRAEVSVMVSKFLKLFK